MINPIELIQKYKDEGHTCDEAVKLAKKELKEKKAYNAKSNREHTIDHRHMLTKRNYSG